MKSYIKHILNEARVLRTIDPKIWASMSSASSKNRATLGINVKPMKRDDKQILLQKYVAGLLTIKAECPSTEADIDNIKAYRLIGHAAIDAGVTLNDILKLYVENGGTYNGPVSTDNITNNDAETNDYPDYDSVNIDDDNNNGNNTLEFPTYDDVDIKDDTEDLNNDISIKDEENEYPAYDEVETNTFEDKYNINTISSYLKSLNVKFKGANKGQYLCWDSDNGFILSNTNDNAIAVCIGASYQFIDKKPRFMVLNISESELGNNGNNDVYDSYYFKQEQGLRGRLNIKPGSNYYHQELINGKKYTSILADNNNKAAELAILPLSIKLNGISDKLVYEIKDQLVKYQYLPTLPELVSALDRLQPGKYWTSSITNNGDSNIALSILPTKAIMTSNPNDKAKVVTFISF